MLIVQKNDRMTMQHAFVWYRTLSQYTLYGFCDCEVGSFSTLSNHLILNGMHGHWVVEEERGLRQAREFTGAETCDITCP